jgi:hypothetical protein
MLLSRIGGFFYTAGVPQIFAIFLFGAKLEKKK